MANTIIFSTYIHVYGISVKFADVVTSDTPTIINNNVVWMFSFYMEFTNFSTWHNVWISPFMKLHAPSPASRAR